MRILHAIDSLNPACGGTTFGLRGLVTSLVKAGHRTAILVADEADSPWLQDWPCPVHPAGRGSWPDGRNDRYESLGEALMPETDAVVVHGIWRYNSRIMRRICLRYDIPYFVYPHGMLDRWFSQRYPVKHFFKQLYWWAAEGRVLQDADAVFFTTVAELEAGRDTFKPFKVHAAFAPFGIMPPPERALGYQREFRSRFPELSTIKTFLFLGRLHTKKGCDILIEGFARWLHTLPHEEAQRWMLRLAGPAEDEAYTQHLHKISEYNHLVEGRQISFVGSVSGREKWQEIANADAMVLPSHQENFGIVLAESMACGRPVLISDKVNGWEQIQDAGAGLVESDSVEGVVRLFNRWYALADESRQRMARAARMFFDQHMSADVSAAAMLVTLEDSSARRHSRSEANL